MRCRNSLNSGDFSCLDEDLLEAAAREAAADYVADAELTDFEAFSESDAIDRTFPIIAISQAVPTSPRIAARLYLHFLAGPLLRRTAFRAADLLLVLSTSIPKRPVTSVENSKLVLCQR